MLADYDCRYGVFMQISLDSTDGVYRILGYANGKIQINDQQYQRSLLVMPDTLVDDWGPSNIQALEPRHLQSVRALEPEVVLLGTGQRQVFPARALMRELITTGVGLEIMDTASACRTYNILMGEGRRVVAALIIEA